MSKFFVESSTESAIEAFKKKQMYKLVSRADMPNLIDFNYAEKRLYGRVDRYFQPIVPNENFLVMKEIGGSTVESIKVFNFVADAFRDLQMKFRIKLASGEIENNPYLSVIKPAAAYKDPKVGYSKMKLSYSMAIGNIINNKDLVFSNFEEFINKIYPYIENAIKNRPFTYPAYIKSTRCSINISGLAIDIANIDPNNDKAKYENFYQNKNWKFFLTACNTYGFMVDCNMPNRIIADINSDHMMSKIRAYGINIDSADMLITNCYTSVGQSGYSMFKDFLFTIYSNNKRRTIVTETYNQHENKTTIIKVKNYTYQQFLLEIGEAKFLDLYLKIRFLEEESFFSDYEKSVIISEVIQISKTSIPDAMEIFERLLNKTFDYSGSLSYIERRKKKLTKGV